VNLDRGAEHLLPGRQRVTLAVLVGVAEEHDRSALRVVERDRQHRRASAEHLGRAVDEHEIGGA
jgi:hypothetical protein